MLGLVLYGVSVHWGLVLHQDLARLLAAGPVGGTRASTGSGPASLGMVMLGLGWIYAQLVQVLGGLAGVVHPSLGLGGLSASVVRVLCSGLGITSDFPG